MLISIVVPSHRDAYGLWTTYAASFVDLEKDFSRDQWEFIAVLDPDDPDNDVARGFEQQKTCQIIRGNFGGPQLARHAGVERAQGEYIVFLDSHVVPARGMFRSLLDTAENTGEVIVHAPHCFWNRDVQAFGYVMDFKDKFWCCKCWSKPPSDEPFRVAVMGHGAMLVNAGWYRRTGGYGTLQRGWGGEEPYLNLKAWHTGGTVWVDPRTYHWHYMTGRRTAEIYKQADFIRNFMLAAYVNGGQKYLDSIYNMSTIAANGHKTIEEAREAARNPTSPYQADYEAVPAVAADERAIICSGPFGGDLDQLRDYFSKEGVLA